MQILGEGWTLEASRPKMSIESTDVFKKCKKPYISNIPFTGEHIEPTAFADFAEGITYYNGGDARMYTPLSDLHVQVCGR